MRFLRIRDPAPLKEPTGRGNAPHHSGSCRSQGQPRTRTVGPGRRLPCRAPEQHVTSVPSSGGSRNRTARGVSVGGRTRARGSEVIRDPERLGTQGSLRIKLMAQKEWGKKPFGWGTFFNLSCTSPRGAGGAGREGSDLGQLSKAKVMPGATKTPEPESDPCCGFRPVVTRQAQTVCRWCSTADVGESGDAATFALWSSTGKTGRGEVGLAQGEEASAVQCCHLPACSVLAPGWGGGGA